MHALSVSYIDHVNISMSKKLSISPVFRPPVITGNTTLDKGDTLYLDCDTSNSRPRPSVMWFSPEGVMVSTQSILEIMNIHWSADGVYTCVATQELSGATMNNTVNVSVQCECQVEQNYKTYMSPHSAHAKYIN